MSEPTLRPDKLLARLAAVTALVVLVGLLLNRAEISGGTATVGFLLLAVVCGWVAAAGAVYRTRWWK